MNNIEETPSPQSRRTEISPKSHDGQYHPQASCDRICLSLFAANAEHNRIAAEFAGGQRPDGARDCRTTAAIRHPRVKYPSAGS